MTQVEQAQKLLKKLRQDIEVEQGKLAIAKNVASNLETRNKAVLANIEREGNLKQRTITEQTNTYKDQLHSEITKAEAVKTALLTDISKLNQRKASLEDSLDASVEAKGNLDNYISEDSQKHQDLLNQILKLTSEVQSYEVRINDLRTQVRELQTVKQQVEADIEVLHLEQDRVEGKIIELDADFENRKRYLDDQLYETNIKLKKAIDNLVVAQHKDEAIRKAWAEEHMKLDKRTEVVRRMEARVSDAESRIEELQRYDVL